MDPTLEARLPVHIESEQFRLQRELADKITNYASLDDIQILLTRGALPHAAVTRGLTPLHYACFINHFAAAKMLLQTGAKVDAVDEIGCSALHLCAEHGYYRMIKLLLQYMERIHQFEEVPEKDENGRYPSREYIDEPLRLAIKNGHYDCAKLLLENGSNANAIYFDGPEITHISPLDTHFLELLLEYGANPNVYDRKGLTPIMRACRMREKGIEAIKILLSYKADINAKAQSRQDYRTPLHYAVLSGSKQLVTFLITNGADVHLSKEYDKPSVLDIAVLKDDTELLKIILDAGADPNRVYTYIGSSLHLACCSMLNKQEEIIRMLLERGANPNLAHKFDDGSVLKTPFVEYFKSRDTPDSRVVDLLLSHGARVVMRSPISHPSGQLRNMLRLAAKKEQPEILEKMLSLAEDFDLNAVNRLALPDILKAEIMEAGRNPPSLLQCARRTIRLLATPLCPSTIEPLPLPKHMKAFVLGVL